jgi:microcystin-dependent protein
VMTTVAGVSQWANLPAPPTTLPPSGPACGDLAGNYPNPTLKAIQQGAAPAAGGTLDVGLLWSSTAHLGIVFGSGLPNKAQAAGTWYQRTDASATIPPLYFNVDGTATGWIPFTSGGAVSVGVTPPATPAPGTLWFYTDSVNGGGTLYIYYQDANSSQWVPCSPGSSAQAIPPGSMMDYAGGTLPAGWLFANGALVSRTAYPGLFAAIGTTYGAGDGSTTFALPDCGGRVTVGLEAAGGVRLTTAGSGINGGTLGAAGGVQNRTMTLAMLPAGVAFNSAYGAAYSSAGGFASPTTYIYNSDGAQATQPLVQPTIVMNKIIKT